MYRFFNSGYFALYSFYKKRNDAYKLSLLPRYVKPGSLVLDIGAHVGFYTRELAKLAGREGKVVAFEPDPINFGFLKKNTADLPQVKVRHMAVPTSTGSGKLFRSRTLNVDHRMYSESPDSAAIVVETVSVDDFTESQSPSPGFIKMDIQGFEFEAFIGMRKTLKAHHPVILTEFWPWGLRRAGSSAQAVVDFILALDYKIYLVDEKKRALAPLELSGLSQSESDYYDLICHV